MFRSMLDWLELKLDLAKEALSIRFTKYKGLWEQQNREIDLMRCSHGKEVKRLKGIIDIRDNEIKDLKTKVEASETQVSDTKKELSKLRAKSKKEYLDLMDKYQDTLIKNQNLIDEKRKLSSSKGGLNSSIKFRDKKINKLEKENKDLKNLLQQVVKETKHRFTAPTIQELKNYKLYGNKKGRRK